MHVPDAGLKNCEVVLQGKCVDADVDVDVDVNVDVDVVLVAGASVLALVLDDDVEVDVFVVVINNVDVVELNPFLPIVPVVADVNSVDDTAVGAPVVVVLPVVANPPG